MGKMAAVKFNNCLTICSEMVMVIVFCLVLEVGYLIFHRIGGKISFATTSTTVSRLVNEDLCQSF